MALNIIFMGTPKFAVPSLDSIFKSNHNILEVYTQPLKRKTVVKRSISLLYINIALTTELKSITQ